MSVSATANLKLVRVQWGERSDTPQRPAPLGYVIGRTGATGDASGGVVALTFTLPQATFANTLLRLDGASAECDGNHGTIRFVVGWGAQNDGEVGPYYSVASGSALVGGWYAPTQPLIRSPLYVGGRGPVLANTQQIVYVESTNVNGATYIYSVIGWAWSVSSLGMFGDLGMLPGS